MISEDLQLIRLNAPTGCKVCYALDQLSENEASALRAALAQPRVYTHVALADVLSKNGHKMSEASVRRHRREEDL